MTQINGESYKIKVRSPDSFSIGDTTKFDNYITGGIATEVKMPVY
jgi:ubiquitin-activating enzyme E1